MCSCFLLPSRLRSLGFVRSKETLMMLQIQQTNTHTDTRWYSKHVFLFSSASHHVQSSRNKLHEWFIVREEEERELHTIAFVSAGAVAFYADNNLQKEEEEQQEENIRQNRFVFQSNTKGHKMNREEKRISLWGFTLLVGVIEPFSLPPFCSTFLIITD